MRAALLAVSLCSAIFPPNACGGDPEPPRRLLLLGQGPDGHPRSTHEYVAGLRIVKKCLARVPGLEVTFADAGEPFRDGPALLDKSDGVVLFLSEGAKWLQQDEKRVAAFERLAARRGGCTALHWGMGCRDARYIEKYVALFGGCHGGPDRKYAVVTVKTEVAGARHPVMTGVAPVKLEDEFYYQLKFAKTEHSVAPLLRVPIDGESHTVAWSWERPDQGRSFGFSGLHFHRDWGEAAYRRMVAQGILWTLKLPIPDEGVDVEVTDDDLKLPE